MGFFLTQCVTKLQGTIKAKTWYVQRGDWVIVGENPLKSIKFVENHLRAQSPGLKITGVWGSVPTVFPRPDDEHDQRQDAEFGGSSV